MAFSSTAVEMLADGPSTSDVKACRGPHGATVVEMLADEPSTSDQSTTRYGAPGGNACGWALYIRREGERGMPSVIPGWKCLRMSLVHPTTPHERP